MKKIDNMVNVTRKPLFSVQIEHPTSTLMNITFEINDGGWQEIKNYSNVGNGTYNAKSPKLTQFNTLYSWRVTATDGINTTIETFQFTTEPQSQYLGLAYCYGMAWGAQSIEDKDVFYVGWEEHPHEHINSNDHYIWYREYDRDIGWSETGDYVANITGMDYEQAVGAYWDDKYWFAYKGLPHI